MFPRPTLLRNFAAGIISEATFFRTNSCHGCRPNSCKVAPIGGPAGRCKNRHAPLLSDGRPNPYVHPFVNLYSLCERLGRRIWKHVQTHPFIRFSKKKNICRNSTCSPVPARGASPRGRPTPSGPPQQSKWHCFGQKFLAGAMAAGSCAFRNQVGTLLICTPPKTTKKL